MLLLVAGNDDDDADDDEPAPSVDDEEPEPRAAPRALPTVGALEIPELAICSQSSSSLNLDISPPTGPSADSICSILNDTRRFGPEGPPPDDRQLRPGSLLLGPAPPPKAGSA